MRIPVSYNLRNLTARRLTTAITLGGVMLVSFVFAAVLMLAHGLEQTLVATGSDANAIILRKASNAEMMSVVSRDSANVVKSFAEIAYSGDGKPILSTELVVVTGREKKGGDEMGNVTVRGVLQSALILRPEVNIVQGRMFRDGSTEIVVGKSIVERFLGFDLGETIRFATQDWQVVGHFESAGNGFESEIWGDVEQMMAAFGRPVFSSVTFRMKAPDAFATLRQNVDSERRLQALEVRQEREYYESQSSQLAGLIRALGLVVTIIFSFAAIIGAMITMYTAVANRTKEIGTLRALGFHRRHILLAFVFEALLLSLIGGGLGVLLASMLQTLTISTTNFNTFSELAFGFRMSVEIVIWTLSFAAIMGLVGGFLPSVRAARLGIVDALRAG